MLVMARNDVNFDGNNSCHVKYKMIIIKKAKEMFQDKHVTINMISFKTLVYAVEYVGFCRKNVRTFFQSTLNIEY